MVLWMYEVTWIRRNEIRRHGCHAWIGCLRVGVLGRLIQTTGHWWREEISRGWGHRAEHSTVVVSVCCIQRIVLGTGRLWGRADFRCGDRQRRCQTRIGIMLTLIATTQPPRQTHIYFSEWAPIRRLGLVLWRRRRRRVLALVSPSKPYRLRNQNATIAGLYPRGWRSLMACESSSEPYRAWKQDAIFA